MKKILIIVASNNENLKLALNFKDHFKQYDSEVALIDLVSTNLPMYTQKREKEGIPVEIFEYMKLLENADSVLFVTPEYNGGVPPILSNFIAWISRSGDSNWRKCFLKKTAALATHSGNGGLRVLTQLRMQLAYLGMNVIGRDVVTTFEKILSNNDLLDVVKQLVDSR